MIRVSCFTPTKSPLKVEPSKSIPSAEQLTSAPNVVPLNVATPVEFIVNSDVPGVSFIVPEFSVTVPAVVKLLPFISITPV